MEVDACNSLAKVAECNRECAELFLSLKLLMGGNHQIKFIWLRIVLVMARHERALGGPCLEGKQRGSNF